MKDEIIQKLTSRKFWVAVAAFLGSVATTIGGLSTDNEAVAITGIICGTVSAAIYAAAEAYTDGARAKADTKTTATTVTATSNNKETVEKILVPAAPEPIASNPGGTD